MEKEKIPISSESEMMPIDIDGDIYMIPGKVNKLIFSYLRRTGDYDGEAPDGYKYFFKFVSMGEMGE